MATKKITINELKKLVKRVVNEDFEFQFSDEENEKFRKSNNIGGSTFLTCSNGFEWKRNINAYAAQSMMNMALSGRKDILCVLMDGKKPKAIAEIDDNYEIKEIKGMHNWKIGNDSEIRDCVLELGEYLGRERAALILRKGGSMGFMN